MYVNRDHLKTETKPSLTLVKEPCFFFSHSAAKVYPEEITPLLPAISGEKIAEDQTCFFLQILLKYMVIQVREKSWDNSVMVLLSVGKRKHLYLCFLL